MADSDTKRFKDLITRDTAVPLGAALAVFMLVFGAHNFWAGKMHELSMTLNRIDNRLVRIEERGRDRWTLTEMKLWVERLRQRNPGMEIPDPEKLAGY